MERAGHCRDATTIYSAQPIDVEPYRYTTETIGNTQSMVSAPGREGLKTGLFKVRK